MTSITSLLAAWLFALHSLRCRYPLQGPADAVAPDLLKEAREAGMDPSKFGDDVMNFMTGGLSAEEIVARRKAAKQ